ncbi:MAG: hypothetical protein NTY35_10640 [Planctomycetota bacterium]|nr:hypothetical protein [Planctomycetota bacterium]
MDARAPASAFRRIALSPTSVSEFLRMEDIGSVFDPWAWHRQVPGIDVEVPWAEHPRGVWHQRTNALGIRRDSDPSPRAPDWRVLVTGDSHTDGVCDNVDSFCSLMEAELRSRSPARSIEVLNAARSGSSFANYLGVLERWLAVEPDVFVVVVYGGNDFVEALGWQRLMHGLPTPEPTVVQRASIEKALQSYGPAVAQAFSAVAAFTRHPEDRELALQAARDVTIEIQALCARFGIRLVVAYLPPAADVEWELHAKSLGAARDILGFSPEDLACTGLMADSYLAFLRSRSIETVDLRAALRGPSASSREPREAMYWEGDYHLDLAGHRAVAQALLAVLGDGGVRARARQAPGTLRPGLPQWGSLLAPGAPGPLDWARWSRPTTETAPAGDRPPWARREFDARTVELADVDEFDARRGRRYRGGLDLERPGAPPWRLGTDAEGLRNVPGSEDAPGATSVLVLGDEEVDAARPDAERLPALLARAWRRDHPGTRIRVRDAARSGHAFDAYMGAIESLGVRPAETVVLVVDADTDFLQQVERRIGVDAAARESVGRYVASLDAGRAPYVLGPGALESLARFGRTPQDGARAQELSVAATLAIDAAVRAAGARLVVVFCPAAIEIDALEMAPSAREACAGLGLDNAAQSVLARVGRRYVAELQTRGVTVFDVGWCVPPHPGRLTEAGTDAAGVALQAEIAEVLVHLLDAR